MDIKDISGSWRQEGGVGGLYIVRSSLEAFSDRVRIGVAGIRSVSGTVSARLKRHGGKAPVNPSFLTHLYQPFDRIILALALPGWSQSQLRDAERILYYHFLTNFPREESDRADDSIFIVSPDRDMSAIKTELIHDLEKLRLVLAPPAEPPTY